MSKSPPPATTSTTTLDPPTHTTPAHLPPSQIPSFPHRSSSLQPSSPRPPDPQTIDDAEVKLSDGLGRGVGGDGGRGDGRGDATKNDMDNAKERIEAFDWEGLEEGFYVKMEECRRVEEGLMGEFGELVEVFNAWATAGAVGDEERAGKRLRTRMAFVQQKEESLEEKRLHYLKVVQAFESALALLSAA